MLHPFTATGLHWSVWKIAFTGFMTLDVKADVNSLQQRGGAINESSH